MANRFAHAVTNKERLTEAIQETEVKLEKLEVQIRAEVAEMDLMSMQMGLTIRKIDQTRELLNIFRAAAAPSMRTVAPRVWSEGELAEAEKKRTA